MRLIDADYVLSALGIFNDRENGNEHFLNGIETSREIVENAPTICVPQDIPLRCRTCSFFADAGGGLTSMTGVGVCKMFGGTRTKDDYCSKGAWISNAAN